MRRDFYPSSSVDSSGQSWLLLKSPSSVVSVAEEDLLYDVCAIVSAVGGSLGLFLGISCYGIIEKWADKLWSVVASKA